MEIAEITHKATRGRPCGRFRVPANMSIGREVWGAARALARRQGLCVSDVVEGMLKLWLKRPKSFEFTKGSFAEFKGRASK
jgi:hypothetical protein